MTCSFSLSDSVCPSSLQPPVLSSLWPLKAHVGPKLMAAEHTFWLAPPYWGGGRCLSCLDSGQLEAREPAGTLMTTAPLYQDRNAPNNSGPLISMPA